MRKFRNGPRARLGALVCVVAVVGGGFVVASTLNAGAATPQKGLNNYAGPKTCAQAALAFGTVFDNCTTATDVVQESSGPSGRNVFEAQGFNSTAVQTALEAFQSSVKNDAYCQVSRESMSPDTSSVSQTCDVDQTGDGGNSVNVAMSDTITHQAGNIGDVAQSASMKLIVRQKSTSGANTVTGPAGSNPALNISEVANQTFGADPAQITHNQSSFQLASIRQVATGSGVNFVKLRLNRNQQASTFSGRPSSQSQDTTVDPSATSGCPAGLSGDPVSWSAARNGNICVLQRSNTGNQTAILRAKDTKNLSATNVPTGNAVNQQQGPADVDGGWLAEVDQNSANNAAGGYVDLGDPCPGPPPDPDGTTDCSAVDGVGKNWTMTASGVGGVAVPGNSSQNDGILDNVIGRSPCAGQITAWTKLNGRATRSGPNPLTTADDDPGTTQAAVLDTVAKTKTLDLCNRGDMPHGGTPGVTGSISAQGDDFGKRVNFGGTSVSAHIGCVDQVNGAPTECATTENITASPSNFSAVRGVPFTNQVVATFTAAGAAADYSATIDWGDGSSSPADGQPVVIDGNGGNFGTGGSYSVKGSHTYATAGTKDVSVTITKTNDPSITATTVSKATVSDVTCPSTGGCFVIGRSNGSAYPPPSPAYFWGNDWAVNNIAASSAFKGFASNPGNPCGNLNGTWTSTGGTSPPPAGTLPEYIAVIVSSKVTAKKNGSSISGDIKQVVVVKRNLNPDTYSPNSGGVGTGTVVGKLCG